MTLFINFSFFDVLSVEQSILTITLAFDVCIQGYYFITFSVSEYESQIKSLWKSYIRLFRDKSKSFIRFLCLDSNLDPNLYIRAIVCEMESEFESEYLLSDFDSSDSLI